MRFPRRCRGLTLIELLVSLVIMGFVMTLVSQAVFQVGQLVRVADESVIRLADRWKTGWAVSDAFANMVAPREAADRPVTGTAIRLAAYTSSPLDGSGTGTRPMVLLLRRTSDQGTEMLYQGADARDGTIVARWAGRAEFRYRSMEGQESDLWPPWTRPSRDDVLLPAAVQLVEPGSGAILMAFPVPAAGARQSPAGTNPFGSDKPGE